MTALETDPDTIERWKDARQEELDAEAIYRALAAAQTTPERAELFGAIAEDEREHAAHAFASAGKAMQHHHHRNGDTGLVALGNVESAVAVIVRDAEAADTVGHRGRRGRRRRRLSR